MDEPDGISFRIQEFAMPVRDNLSMSTRLSEYLRQRGLQKTLKDTIRAEIGEAIGRRKKGER